MFNCSKNYIKKKLKVDISFSELHVKGMFKKLKIQNTEKNYFTRTK